MCVYICIYIYVLCIWSSRPSTYCLCICKLILPSRNHHNAGLTLLGSAYTKRTLVVQSVYLSAHPNSTRECLNVFSTNGMYMYILTHTFEFYSCRALQYNKIQLLPDNIFTSMPLSANIQLWSNPMLCYPSSFVLRYPYYTACLMEVYTSMFYTLRNKWSSLYKCKVCLMKNCIMEHTTYAHSTCALSRSQMAAQGLGFYPYTYDNELHHEWVIKFYHHTFSGHNISSAFSRSQHVQIVSSFVPTRAISPVAALATLLNAEVNWYWNSGAYLQFTLKLLQEWPISWACKCQCLMSHKYSYMYISKQYLWIKFFLLCSSASANSLVLWTNKHCCCLSRQVSNNQVSTLNEGIFKDLRSLKTLWECLFWTTDSYILLSGCLLMLPPFFCGSQMCHRFKKSYFYA